MADALDFTDRATILVVDDTPDNLQLMSGLLKDLYKVQVANSGERALKIVKGEHPPDLVLLDIMMPGMDGYEVCRRLIADPKTRDIPIIFLTAKATVADEEMGFELGASDYITKPVSPPITLARIKAQLMIKASRDFLKDQSAFLESEVARRTAESGAIQEFTIQVLASLAEARDKASSNHIQRTQRYVRALAERLADVARFAGALAGEQIELICKCAPLYDVGKIGIPDRILLKREPLTPEEFDILKTHTTLGRDAIEKAERNVGVPVAFLKCAKEITLSHEERWDGSGYPQGLSGDDIPVAARLMAVADVYDALIGEGTTHEQAVKTIAEGKGMLFDPDVADAFVAVAAQIAEIVAKYPDTGGATAV
ncbi:MAG: two-component system response regulator [Betaproteobacteria bacterium]|nr:MAG: two-component system response regulator [Betaproteobacteria bacterium]